jgi:hypothetical protein
MSSRKLDKSAFEPIILDPSQTHLTLAPDNVRFRKSGIEFHSPVPLNQWMEMTVQLESPRDGKTVCCNGIVVACEGNRHAGFAVSLLFTGLTRQTQAQLNQIAFSALA